MEEPNSRVRAHICSRRFVAQVLKHNIQSLSMEKILQFYCTCCFLPVQKLIVVAKLPLHIAQVHLVITEYEKFLYTLLIWSVLHSSFSPTILNSDRCPFVAGSSSDLEIRWHYMAVMWTFITPINNQVYAIQILVYASQLCSAWLTAKIRHNDPTPIGIENSKTCQKFGSGSQCTSARHTLHRCISFPFNDHRIISQS